MPIGGSPAMTIRVRAVRERACSKGGGETDAGANGSLAHFGRWARAASPDRSARARRPEGDGDQRPYGSVRRDGAALAPTLQRTRPARAGGGRTQRAATDLLRGAEECRDQHGADPSDGSGPAVRVL